MASMPMLYVEPFARLCASLLPGESVAIEVRANGSALVTVEHSDTGYGDCEGTTVQDIPTAVETALARRRALL